MTKYREIKPEDITAEFLDALSREYPRVEFREEDLHPDPVVRALRWFSAEPLQ